MAKDAKLKKLMPSPLRRRYVAAHPEQKQALESLAASEREAVIAKMGDKGYRLEAVVGEVYGLFTRGSAVGTTRMASRDEAEAK